jgi:uncharacterized small protein (DUF1192 family)
MADTMKTSPIIAFPIIPIASAAFLSLIAPLDLSYAQTPDTPPPKADVPAAAPKPERTGPSDNQIANDVDAKIARLKADLQLTAEQETNWGLLETTLHDYGVAQFKRSLADKNMHQDRHERPNDIAMMRDEANRLSARADALKKLASAADPLYGTLDDHQRRRLAQFMQHALEYDQR